jgi:hypothetical protein
MRWFIAATLLFVMALLSTTCSTSHPRRKPSEVKITVEIDQLAQAMAGYKQSRIQYPPCMAEEDAETRKKRFLRHVSLGFTNASYGSTTAHFDALNRKLEAEWSYNFRGRDGKRHPLDLERLDAAETLVFWLGGFPMPLDGKTQQPIANRKLFGFHRDEDDPFKRDFRFETPTPLQFRTDPMFNFMEERLTDSDDDGWLEYVPYLVHAGAPPPPYAYFDYDAYAPSKTNPALLGSCFYPRDNELAGRWGIAVPIAEYFSPPQKQIIWNNASSIQIVAAGLDGRFGPPGKNGVMPPREIMTWPLVRKIYLATEDFQRARELDESQLDNLTNLSSKPLGTKTP